VSIAAANRADPTWYRRVQEAPLYRRDLDLVAVAPDGAIAAFCTLWFDDPTRSVCIEPLATVPAHRRLGLARAVLTEGLRRAQRLGADLALVGGYDDGANALYGAVVGGAHDRSEAWARRW
jgi:mycothiol synthase